MKPEKLREALKEAHRFMRKENPELRYRLWHVKKFVPDHCPTCGKRFLTGNDHTFLSRNNKTQRQYNYSLPYSIAICGYCNAYTATVDIESHVVRTKREAQRLVKRHGFTVMFFVLATKKDLEKRLKNPRKIYPLGLGLAATAKK